MSGRLLSARRALISLSAGLVAGAVVGLVATPRLLPLVSWTVTVAVLLTWVWRKSWPQDPRGTKRLAEHEGTSRSTDVWLLAAAVPSLAVVVVALVQSSGQRNATAVASVILSVLSVTLSWALVNALRAAGAYVDVVSLRRGRIRGLNLNLPATRVRVDSTVEQTSAGAQDGPRVRRERQARRHAVPTAPGCLHRPGSSKAAP